MSKTQFYQKMIKVMEKVGKLQKDGDITDKNGKKMYSYLSEEQTTSTLQKLFVEIGLVMFPIETKEELIYIEGVQYDKPFRNPVTKVVVTYKLVDSETGEFETIQTVGYGADNQDKGSNKAMTGAFKYAQRQSFMISSGEDPDHVPSVNIPNNYTPIQQVGQQRLQQEQAKAAVRQQSSAQVTSSGSNVGSIAARVYKMREELGWGWPDLSQFVGEVLNRDIKFLKKDVTSEVEWKQIEDAMTASKEGMVGAH